MDRLRSGMAGAVLAMLVLACAGCGGEGIGHVLTSLDLEGAGTDKLQAPEYYPEDMPIGEPLEIEVVRTTRKRIAIDNRTTQAWGGARIWINRQYGAVLDQLALGKNTGVALNQFVNMHGEEFPVGSFLTPEQSKTVIAADLEANGQLHKLIVRLPDDWQEP